MLRQLFLKYVPSALALFLLVAAAGWYIFVEHNAPVRAGSSDNVAGWQTVSVITDGISDVHSGLSAGTVYYAQDDGTLTTSATDYQVGMTISSSEILLDK